MHELIKLLCTCFTVLSVFFSSFTNPATLNPETPELDISFLSYPKAVSYTHLTLPTMAVV